MIDGQLAKWVNVTPPAAISDNTALTTNEIDTLGWDYLEIAVILGATDIAMAELKVQESDTSGSGHADITGLVFGTSNKIDGAKSDLPSATDDNKIFLCQIDLRKRKRYIDVSAKSGDGSAGTYCTIVARLSRGKVAPSNAAGAGAAAILRV
ncbi:MAG TPA: hypothetical protein PKZ08_11500 [Vicinamibacterales bacterium]|nr:hypothetical protein [Vicinamibacterales bacterium]